MRHRPLQQPQNLLLTILFPQVGRIGSASTIKAILPFTPLVCKRNGKPLSTDIATFKRHDEDVKPAANAKCSLGNASFFHLRGVRPDVEAELMKKPAPLVDLGPWFHPGDTGRLQRRYARQTDAHVFDLSHALFGRHQICALVEFLLLQQNTVEELRLENNSIDDKNLEILVNGLKRKGGSVTKLNLAQNNLTHMAVDILIPLLKVTQSLEVEFLMCCMP